MQLKTVPVIAPTAQKSSKGSSGSAGNEEEEAEADPFDTSIAASVLPNKGDPFDTEYVKEGDLGKAELKALEKELLSAGEDKSVRARPKPGAVAAVEEEEEEEIDPFDTTLADRVIAGESLEPEKKEDQVVPALSPIPARVEDEDFDPSRTFARSVSVKSEQDRLRQQEQERQRAAAQEAAQREEEERRKRGGLGLAAPPTKREVQQAQKKQDSIDSDDFDPRA